ncbi:MAG TPA: hypothetical protein VLJ38_07005 [Polyangiaceae bacterium]|nr:hypothetical protein [Polyangiaceae bacterium]
MRARRGWVRLLGLGMLLCAVSVEAQPNKARVGRSPKSAPASKPSAASAPAASESSKPDSAKTETAAPGESAPATSGSASVTSGDDLGAPPPKQTNETSGPRKSPLTPEPNEFPQGAPKPPPPAYDQLLSDIAALRSRVAAVTTTLFSSKLRVLVSVDGDDARIASFRVTLDDGVVYAAPENFGGGEPLVVYEHAVAPGHHMLGIEIERYDARNREYRTYQSSKFSVVVPESKHLESSFRIKDASDMAGDFPKGHDGEYDLRVRLRARVVD